MADFITQGPVYVTEFSTGDLSNLSGPTQVITSKSYSSGPLLATNFLDGLVASSGPTQVITVTNYSQLGQISNVSFTTGLSIASLPSYMDNSTRRPTSGPTVSLELGLIISTGSSQNILPTGGQIWPINN